MVDGLSQYEAEERLEEYGPNELEEKNKTTRTEVLLNQFKSNFLVWILMVAAALSYWASFHDPDKIYSFYFVTLIIGIIIVLGYIQEWKAEKAMEELEKMTEPVVEVIRDGSTTEIKSKNVVPGDILVVNMGDKIPADATAIDPTDMKVDEAILTGESEAVDKEDGDDLYAGTTVVHGKCLAEVTGTGMDTELGNIAEEIQQEEEKTPLQRKMDTMGKRLAGIALIVCTAIFLLGWYDGSIDTIDIMLVAIALMVASVPEGLPLALTLTLAKGMKDMAEKNAIVKKMLAVEGLGSTTVICTDKTGTLTRNEMTVKQISTANHDITVEGSGYTPKGALMEDGNPVTFSRELDLLLKSAGLCNNADLRQEEEEWKVIGDPTEGALTVLAAKAGFGKDDLEIQHPREKEILFTSERKRMTTVHEMDGSLTAFTKGAPEVVLDHCTHIQDGNEKKELTDEMREAILEKNSEYAQDALRVLALAYRDDVEEPLDADNVEQDLVYLGMVGMIDPPRKEVEHAINTCEGAGINVKMVTGDNPETAEAIATRIGLTDDPHVLTGDDIEDMSDEELEDTVPDVDIYARTRPEHKLHIVEALQEDGEIVGMTGDGVNDAPAVKKADIGIGMGIKGTDVTKEASDIILRDDNFDSIVTAVKDGRRIYDNIEKFTTYLISRNFTEIIIILMAIMLFPFMFGESGFQYIPLIALQILFINVIGEEFPAISLGLDPAVKGIMQRPPRDPGQHILRIRNFVLVISMAIFMATVGFVVFMLGQPFESMANLDYARTMAFAAIVMMVIVHTFNFRSLTRSVRDIDIMENRLVLASIAFVIPVTLAVIYLDIFAQAFGHTPLSLMDWGIATLGALITFGYIEAQKKVLNRYLPENF